MTAYHRSHEHYQRISKALHYISQHAHERPTLGELARQCHMSEFHFQRTFSDWVGLSPKQYMQTLSVDRAKRILHDFNIEETSEQLGLSSPSRLHDLMIKVVSMTPGEYRSGGEDLRIAWGVHPCPFGFCLIAKTERGICHLSFYDRPDEYSIDFKSLIQEWPNATWDRDDPNTLDLVQQIFDSTHKEQNSVLLHLRGSEFQIQVWQALLRIPEKTFCSYQSIAEVIGRPKATRAVASAIAKNSIALLIPCHRVIRSTGEINQYRWGKARKQAIIAWESTLN